MQKNESTPCRVVVVSPANWVVVVHCETSMGTVVGLGVAVGGGFVGSAETSGAALVNTR